MDPKKSEIPKIEFQSTEDKTKKIVAIMEMLPITYSELRILPDSEINILLKVLTEREVVKRERYVESLETPYYDNDNDYGCTDEIMPF